ncbi:Ohr family peroxiredoxin [Staphylococcus lutrae]|uniref:Peroxiredoxin n=1 Tax=Staphylococcus lutrae TaxID=155085 RepID=A0AAC9RPS5_9STAP|nr:Ohr family peroxiredoxin [Staphylococcus lutrae]ARJ51336.1 peroxiredoxin [Staphylococcus lutrae]PNZ35846.1 peroxiredoxin [Staphylococcus lutrae]
MTVIYQTTATNTGGRKGQVETEDQTLKLNLAPPDHAKEGETNPEQLFAAGYASCFNGAFDMILKRNGFRQAEPVVALTVQLMDDPDSESPMLGVDIQATVKNMSQEDAEQCLKETHEFCPYSKATRGNIAFNMAVRVVE